MSAILHSLQVIEVKVDSFMASFHEWSIGNRMTNCFIFSDLFKCRDDVIDIELPKIVYSVFNVTNTIYKVQQCYFQLTRQLRVRVLLHIESHNFYFSTIYWIEF